MGTPASGHSPPSCTPSVYRFGTGKQQIFEQVLSAGIDGSDLQKAVDRASAGESPSFEELRDLGESSGVFTLAEGWDPAVESFEAYVDLIAPGRLAQAVTVVGRSKPRQGRHMASGTECPGAVDALY